MENRASPAVEEAARNGSFRAGRVTKALIEFKSKALIVKLKGSLFGKCHYCAACLRRCIRAGLWRRSPPVPVGAVVAWRQYPSRSISCGTLPSRLTRRTTLLTSNRTSSDISPQASPRRG